MRKTAYAALLLPFAVAACAARGTDFDPAPGAQLAPVGPGDGAVATEAGVRIEARADAWQGLPRNLEQELTPFLVEITNNSQTPLLLRYRNFRLEGTAGRIYTALPPFDLDAAVTDIVRVPVNTFTGFTVAPYLSPFYPGITVASPFIFDEPFYTTYTPVVRQIALPTGDMIQKALPEGVLAPGGKVTGFLYFEEVSSNSPRVEFVAELRNAATHAQFGTIEIPFVVN